MALTDGWNRRNRAPQQVPLHPGPDPEHATPTDNPEYPPGQLATWQSTVHSPTMPEAVMPGGPMELATGFGPVDHTPEDHSYGLGVLPGVPTLVGQDIMRGWHNDDQGSVAAEAYNHAKMRDGAPHVAWIEHQIGDGESPQTLQYERTGVGQPNDPNARAGKRLKRWYDRYIDMHRYAVEMEPYAARYAEPTQTQPPVSGGGQYDSPYFTAASYFAGPPDRFVRPFVYRTPGPWDEAEATDGTEQTMAGAPAQYGLTQWGM